MDFYFFINKIKKKNLNYKYISKNLQQKNYEMFVISKEIHTAQCTVKDKWTRNKA